jgi:hypothetical protein
MFSGMGREKAAKCTSIPKIICVHNVTYRSFVAGVSQLTICDFSGETFKGFEVL